MFYNQKVVDQQEKCDWKQNELEIIKGYLPFEVLLLGLIVWQSSNFHLQMKGYY